ncbi:hypothetical protein AGMMS49992_25070 [Clostridia bacterium]|nr:hypothetical protein AGMMS49992_25070 [Clostridia bacterium]
MKTAEIVFTNLKQAQLIEKERELLPLNETQVLVATEYTVISAGTERANLLATPNRGDIVDALPPEKAFPITVGYSGSGVVKAVGSKVQHVAPGDRVATCWGKHSTMNIFDGVNVIKIQDDSIRMEDAALAMIAGISLGGVRKTHLEIGESVLVMGQGIIGILATVFSRIAGGVPLLAADIRPERLALAKALGADFALNPLEEGFTRMVHDLTNGKGVDNVIEVTGVDAALSQSLDCIARQGTIALLGCTRVPTEHINFYQKVHRTGVNIIGAHTMIKPQLDSYPGYWTCADDVRVYLAMLAAHRLDVSPLVQEMHKPSEAPDVFGRLADEPNFPVGVFFDWRGMSI